MRNNSFLALLVFLGCFIISNAQTGTLSGKILDGDFNDALAFANVAVKGTNYGSATDFDGKYSIEMAPGTYTVVFTFVGYTTKQITDVVIKSGQITDLTVTMTSAADALESVVITVTKRKNSEKAVLEVQKNATIVLDGLSSETIKKAGSSSVASAVKTVPGVSVQGGKFVYVRGLGDRYTKTLLNGMEVPGLDPDRNALQLDIFPTGVLENLQVKKSATADLTADFTGGIVDILTKDIPSGEEYAISLSLGYNPNMHFNDNYLTYTGGGTDFLGFDDGTRDSPIATGANVPLLQVEPQRVRELTQSFNPELAAMQERSFMDYGFSFSGGNKYRMESGNALGFTASLSYKNETEFYEDFIAGQIFRKDQEDRSNFSPIVDRTQQGSVGINNVLLNGLAGLTYKTEFSKYRFNVLHVQNGESKAAVIFQQNAERGSNESKKDVLTYTQRTLTNVLFSGDHNNSDGTWNLEWKLSPTFSRVDDKDFRITPFRIDSGVPTVEPSETGDPTRLYRELEEINIASRIDVTRRHKLFSVAAKFKFGAGYIYKSRDFLVDQYSFILQNFQGTNFDGNANNILDPANIYNPATDSGVAVRSDFNLTNNFDSQITVGSAYVSDEFQITERLKSVVGLRFEKFDLMYTGQNQRGDVFNNEKFIDKADLFPSVNLIYNLDEQGSYKLRGSYARTTARPSFREASEAEIFDPISNFFFIGNKDIQPSYIQNVDFRFEKYGEGSDFYAISTFYKGFKDPIELSFIRSAEGQFTPLNLGRATVIGAEFEVRKNLGFVPLLKNFNVSVNVSLIDSRQNYSEDEENNRRDTLREGQTLEDTRPLQGQSPYLINAGLVYETESNIRVGAFFNVQGRTLEIVGSGDIPDVYTLPFNSFNINANKTFGEKIKHSIGFKIENLLGDDVESEYDFYNSDNRLFAFRSPETSFSLNYGIKF
jgi:TonB-dependent receptor